MEPLGIRVEFQSIWRGRRLRKLGGLVGKWSDDVLSERKGLEPLASYDLLGCNDSAPGGRVRDARLLLAHCCNGSVGVGADNGQIQPAR